MDKTEALNLTFLVGVIVVLVAASVYVNVFWDDGGEEEEEEEEESTEGDYEVEEDSTDADGESTSTEEGNFIRSRSQTGPPGPFLIIFNIFSTIQSPPVSGR